MADSENMPSSDRDIEFCEKAINSGYIVKEIVPSILRKLNEKRIAGIPSSIGQELIALDLMTHEQVKEILLMLENVELTCENCGKKYAIRAYDPGKQYACRECGAYLEPADPDLRMLKLEHSKFDNESEPTSSSSIGDPNPQLADLLPPEEESEEQQETDDPILNAAQHGSLKSKGIASKNVFALDDEMLGEMQKGGSDELNKILGIDAGSEKKKPAEKPSFAKERKLAAQKQQEQIFEKPKSDRRKIQKGGILKEMQQQSEKDDLDALAEQSENLESMIPANIYDLHAELDRERDQDEISGDKLMEQSEFLRMIDPESKNNKFLKGDKDEDDKVQKRQDKFDKKQKKKDLKAEKAYKKYKMPFDSTKSHKRKGINFASIILAVLFFMALISAFMMFKLWIDKKTELTSLQLQLKNAYKKATTLQEKITELSQSDMNKALTDDEQEGIRKLIKFENNYNADPTVKNAKEIAELIKTEVVALHPVFIVNSAEFYQKAGATKDALLMLIDSFSVKDLTTSTKVRISLKIAELIVFDLNNPDIKLAQEYIEEAKKLEDLTDEESRILTVWNKVLSGQHYPVLKLNSRNSFEYNITYLLEKFAGLLPSLHSRFDNTNIPASATATLQKALLLYENNFSVELLGCLNVYASGNKQDSVRKFAAFQKKFGNYVYIQEKLSQLYVDLENFSEAEKVLSWLLNNKKDMTDSEIRRDKAYRDLLIKRSDINVKIGKYNNAIKDLNDLINFFPLDSFQYKVKLGKIYMLLGKYYEASIQFTDAYEHNKDVEITKLLISSYIEQPGRLDSARSLLDEMRNDSKYAKDCDLMVLQGLFYLKKSPRDVDAAIDEFNTALQIDDSHVDALYNKAKLELERNYYPSAKTLIDKLEKVDDSLWQLYFLKGIYFKKKMPNEADSYFKLALKTAPPAKHEEIESYK